MANLRATAMLAALGDDTRRTIFERVAASPLPVGVLASDLPVSRSAVSQHLRVLKEAGLVVESPEGTRRVYRLDPRGIAAIHDWLDALWGSTLDVFQDFADQQAEKDKPE